jgi:hypothetical protein
MLRIRIKMRSGAYASSLQDTDYAGARGGQEFMGRPNIRGSAGPDMEVSTCRFEGRYLWSGPEVVEITFFP